MTYIIPSLILVAVAPVGVVLTVTAVLGAPDRGKQAPNIDKVEDHPQEDEGAKEGEGGGGAGGVEVEEAGLAVHQLGLVLVHQRVRCCRGNPSGKDCHKC